MADRIIKSDSGNDVVIQNNGGTRKIEVTNSGDVEVTGDFKATTVKATNLKANDGTAGLVVADSTGEVTSSGGLKATNIKATNIKANDGTAGLIISDSTGRVSANEKILVDDIIEKTTDHGVEIEGVSLKDSQIISGTLGSSVVNNTSFIGFSGGTNGSSQFTTNGGIILFDQNVVNNGMTIMTGSDTGKIQVDKAGKYFVIANAYGEHGANANGYFGITINFNGSGIAGSGSVGLQASAIRQSVSCQIIKQCAVNDNFYTESVINGDTIFGGINTNMVIIYLGQ